MSTKKPRLTITFEPELAAKFKRLSELTKTSQSALIGELLSGSGPVLDQMIRVIEVAEVARKSIKGRIAVNLDDAQAKLEQALGLALEGFEGVSETLEEVTKKPRKRQAPTASGSAAATGDSGALTPLSNRGVRNSATTLKKVKESSVYLRSELNKKNLKKRAEKQEKKGACHGQV